MRAAEFKATGVWNDIIAYTREHIKMAGKMTSVFTVKRNYSSSCFTGSSLVKCLWNYLECHQDDQKSVNLSSHEVAMKLAQMMLKLHVIRPTNGFDDMVVFKDSTRQMYCFVESSCSFGSANDIKIEAAKTEVSLDSEYDTGDEKSWIDITDSSSSLGKIFSPNSVAYNMAFMEASLSRLLTLIELPHLDDVLSVCDQCCHDDVWDETNAPLADGNVVDGFCYSNGGFLCEEIERQSKRLLMDYSLDGDDSARAMIMSALECLRCEEVVDLQSWPEPIGNDRRVALTELLVSIVCSSAARNDTDCALLPRQHTELHLALIGLISRGRDAVATEACQLVFGLLPNRARRQFAGYLQFVHHLHRFARMTASLRPLQLHRQALSQLAGVVLSGQHVIGADKAVALLQFWADRFPLTVQMNSAVVRKVRRILSVRQAVQSQLVADAKNVDSNAVVLRNETGFCEMISMAEFAKQADDVTEQHLVQLMHTILGSNSFSTRQKQRKLKDLKLQHPAVYVKYFYNYTDL